MFSLGLVLFEVLTGSPLFCNDSEAAEVYHGLSVPALRRKAGAVFIEFCVRRRLNELDISDKTLRDFLYRALQFTPALRPTAAKLMLHPLLPRV
jgi:serine/threonine protein kinase